MRFSQSSPVFHYGYNCLVPFVFNLPVSLTWRGTAQCCTESCPSSKTRRLVKLFDSYLDIASSNMRRRRTPRSGGDMAIWKSPDAWPATVISASKIYRRMPGLICTRRYPGALRAGLLVNTDVDIFSFLGIYLHREILVLVSVLLPRPTNTLMDLLQWA